jgi:anti-anti-sigma factor
MSHITTSTDENVLVIKIEPASINDFDLSNDVEIEIVEAFQRFNTKNAVIDLQNLKTLDSVGLRIFVRMLKKSRKRSGRVILCNATGVVADVLSLSKIVAADAALALVPDKEDAIAALRSSENL